MGDGEGGGSICSWWFGFRFVTFSLFSYSLPPSSSVFDICSWLCSFVHCAFSKCFLSGFALVRDGDRFLSSLLSLPLFRTCLHLSVSLSLSLGGWLARSLLVIAALQCCISFLAPYCFLDSLFCFQNINRLRNMCVCVLCMLRQLPGVFAPPSSAFAWPIRSTSRFPSRLQTYSDMRLEH